MSMPRPPGGGHDARHLLGRLRELLAGEDQGADRLQSVVKLIADTVVADVCSIYVRTPDNSLLLVATEGLSQEAVNRTRLGENEGLVGLISSTARPKRLKNAPAHPRFSYRPETGEDPYHGFLGVPILRAARVLGVLVVQNMVERLYTDEDMDELQTVAMVLAEILSAAGEKNDDLELRQPGSVKLKGRPLNEGMAIGPVYLHDPVVTAARFFAYDIEKESQRLDVALDTLRQSIDTMLNRATPVLFGESRDVLETYRLFAHDPGWEMRLHDAIKAGLTAEAAVDRARREHRARIASSRDGYLRERLHDLEDLENRLLRHLSGSEDGEISGPEPGSILIASRLGPAELLEYREAGLAGVLLEEGGAGSHAAIVARALGLSAIGDVSGLVSRSDAGDQMIIDADSGIAYLRPEEELVANYRARIVLSGEHKAELARLRDLPAETKDGQSFQLMLNAGLSFDLDHLEETGAEGVGLFRTEFQFLTSQTLPSLETQVEFYDNAITRSGDKPLVFRTLDLGGDKVATFIGGEREENPALGWRALRMAMDHPFFFRRQLRALIRAAGERPLQLMFPMVCNIAEFDAARELVDAEVEWAQKFNRATPSRIEIGAMVETPSFAFSIDALKGRAEFLSVGTNDLMQFFFAADRNNPKVSGRYDILSPAALLMMEHIVKAAARAEIPVSVCGEAGGRPLEALVLACLGYRRFSMQAARIGQIKRLIRSMDLAVIAPKVVELVHSGKSEIREELLNLAKENVPVSFDR